MMDIYQYIGDILHLGALLTLLSKILKTRNVIGISYKTQEIFLVVYVSRYMDIFFAWKGLYLLTMKILFMCLTSYIIYLIKIRKPHCLVFE